MECADPCLATGTVNDLARSSTNDSHSLCAYGNASSESENVEADDMSHKIFVAVMTSLLAFVILIGNGLIIVSVTVVRKLRQPANYLIVSLALSDFLVALVVLPLTIVYDILGEWVFGSTICNIHVSFDVICCTTSIMNLCMISIDRYLMITQPMTYPKRRTAKFMALMITTAWVISCLIILPALFGFTRNVTDDPSWIHLGPTSGFQNKSSNSIPTLSPLISGKNDLSASSWTRCSRSSDSWQFAVDLEREYAITKIRLRKNGIASKSFQIQVISQAYPDFDKAQKFDLDFPSTTIIELDDVSARYIRILLNGSSEVQNNDISFDVYGELIHGKSCLISQEVWFTIYSTVGSFYIPLTVMLCMYWKIYVEASRLKARHRARSKSLSDQPPLMLPKSRKKSQMILPIPTLKLYPRDVAPQPEENGSLICEDKAKILQDTDTSFEAPIAIYDDLISTSCDDVFDSKSVATRQSSVDRLECNGRGLENGRHRHNLRQSSETNMCNCEKPQQGRAKSLSVQYEVNGNVLSHCNNQYSLRSGSNWCKSLQYSSNSIKSAPRSLHLQDSTELVDCRQLNGRSDVNQNNQKEERKKSETSFNSSKYSSPFRRSSIMSSRRYDNRLSPKGRLKSRGSIFFNPLLRRVSTVSSRERMSNAKTIRTLGIIVIAFTFCWLPFFILTFIRPFVCENPESQDCFPLWLVRLVLWLGYLNSALNPIIYVGFSSDLRETFKFLICCKCTNVDRRLAQIELRQAIESERKTSDQLLSTIKEANITLSAAN